MRTSFILDRVVHDVTIPGKIVIGYKHATNAKTHVTVPANKSAQQIFLRQLDVAAYGWLECEWRWLGISLFYLCLFISVLCKLLTFVVKSVKITWHHRVNYAYLMIIIFRMYLTNWHIRCDLQNRMQPMAYREKS